MQRKPKETLDEILMNPFNPEFYIVSSLYRYGNTALNNNFFTLYGEDEFIRVLEAIFEIPVHIRVSEYQNAKTPIVELDRSGIPKNGKAASLIALQD